MNAPLRTPFGFSSTAAEVSAGIDLAGRRAVVTGGGSGIGVDTARALAAAGAEVVLAVRRRVSGDRIAAQIRAETGNSQVTARTLDLADLSSISAFVRSWTGPLEILINNAGIMAVPDLELTSHGYELQLATNFLGHFALTVGLHDSLVAASGARVVIVSSSGHLFSPVVFDDLHFAFRPYDPLLAYAQSKTAAILLSVGATQRWSRDGITANALNPGAIPTQLQRHVGGRLRTPVDQQKSPQQGAATSVLLASSPLLDGASGRYFEDCNEAPTVTHRTPEATGVATYALDPEAADRLWEKSLRMLGAWISE